jgi:hypothetical protein
MENKKPECSLEAPVISVVSELHSYFRDLQSYYQIAKGELMSKTEACNDPQEAKQLQEELQKINRKISYFHLLNNSISSADVILHSEEMIQELGK